MKKILLNKYYLLVMTVIFVGLVYYGSRIYNYMHDLKFKEIDYKMSLFEHNFSVSKETIARELDVLTIKHEKYDTEHLNDFGKEIKRFNPVHRAFFVIEPNRIHITDKSYISFIIPSAYTGKSKLNYIDNYLTNDIIIFYTIKDSIVYGSVYSWEQFLTNNLLTDSKTGIIIYNERNQVIYNSPDCPHIDFIQNLSENLKILQKNGYIYVFIQDSQLHWIVLYHQNELDFFKTLYTSLFIFVFATLLAQIVLSLIIAKILLLYK